MWRRPTASLRFSRKRCCDVNYEKVANQTSKPNSARRHEISIIYRENVATVSSHSLSSIRPYSLCGFSCQHRPWGVLECPHHIYIVFTVWRSGAAISPSFLNWSIILTDNRSLPQLQRFISISDPEHTIMGRLIISHHFSHKRAQMNLDLDVVL